MAFTVRVVEFLVLAFTAALLTHVAAAAKPSKSGGLLDNARLCAVDVRKYNLKSTALQVAKEEVLWSNCLQQLASRKGEYGCGDELIFLVKFDRLPGDPDSDKYDVVFHLWANSVTFNDGIGFEDIVSAGPNVEDPEHTAGADLVVLHDEDGPYVEKQEIMSNFRFAVLDVPQGTTAVIKIKAKLTCRPWATTYQNQQSVKLTSLFGTLNAEALGLGLDAATEGVDDYIPQIQSGTVPYFVKDIIGALRPWLEMKHMGTLSHASCYEAVSSMTVNAGDHVKHCITVENKGTEDAVNVVLEDHGFDDNNTPVPGLPSVIPAGTTVSVAYISEINEATAGEYGIEVEAYSASDATVSATSTLRVTVSSVEPSDFTNVNTESSVPSKTPGSVNVQMNLTLGDCGDESVSPSTLIGFIGDSVTRCVRVSNDSPSPFTISSVSNNVPLTMLDAFLQPGESLASQESSLIEQTSTGTVIYDVRIETSTGLIGETQATLLIDIDPVEPDYCWGALTDSGSICYSEVRTFDEQGTEVVACQSRPCAASHKCLSLDPTAIPSPTTSSAPLVPDQVATSSAAGGGNANAGDIMYESPQPTEDVEVNTGVNDVVDFTPQPGLFGNSSISNLTDSSATESLVAQTIPASEAATTTSPTTTSEPQEPTTTMMLLEKRTTSSLDSNCQVKSSTGYVLLPL